MEKRKFLMWVLPFLVTFVAVAGWLYRQKKIDQRRFHSQAASLSAYDAQGKSQQEIARWIYDNHGCAGCHTLTEGGNFGLTSQGQVIARDFEGCPGMLKTVWETVSVPEAKWTDKQRKTRANFARFGCTVCHQVGSKSIDLTEVGSKAAILHMSCSEVASTLNR